MKQYMLIYILKKTGKKSIGNTFADIKKRDISTEQGRVEKDELLKI